MSVGLIGSGSWGTAIMKLLVNNVYKVKSLHWYVREQNIIENLKKFHHNPDYLSSVEIDVNKHKIQLTTDIKHIVNQCDILIFVVPSAFLEVTLGNHNFDFRDKIVVSAIKGVIPNDNLIISEFFEKKYDVSLRQQAVVSGPSHAEEVALERLSYLTVGSPNRKVAEKIASLVSCRYIRTRISNDIFGIEYASVLKNIYALAGGICHGLGYGDNFLAVIVSNGMHEMNKFMNRVNPHKSMFVKFMRRVKPVRRTVHSSVYLGDLLVTAYSQFSRNRTFGTMIGKGYSVKSAQLEMSMIAEGYYAVKCIWEINQKYNIPLPIVNAVYDILYNQQPPDKVIERLAAQLR